MVKTMSIVFGYGYYIFTGWVGPFPSPPPSFSSPIRNLRALIPIDPPYATDPPTHCDHVLLESVGA